MKYLFTQCGNIRIEIHTEIFTPVFVPILNFFVDVIINIVQLPGQFVVSSGLMVVPSETLGIESVYLLQSVFIAIPLQVHNFSTTFLSICLVTDKGLHCCYYITGSFCHCQNDVILGNKINLTKSMGHGVRQISNFCELVSSDQEELLERNFLDTTSTHRSDMYLD